MRDWKTALTLKAEQIRWVESKEGEAYTANFFRSIMGERDVRPAMTPFSAMMGNQIGDYTGVLAQGLRLERSRLRSSPTYWLSPDMFEVVLHASNTMPPEPLHREDVPTPSGFVVFAKNLHFTDGNGDRIGVAAASWGPMVHLGREAKGLALYTAMDDLEDDWVATYRQNDGVPLVDGRVGTIRAGLVMCHYTPWIFEQDYLSREAYSGPWGDERQEDSNYDYERAVQGTVQVLRFLKAFWTISQQPYIAQWQTGTPNRAERRRMERLQLPSTLTLITLRAKYQKPKDGDDHEPQKVEWSHRWVVGAHWATRHTRNGPKKVYIMPFIKGPEDKPLVVKEKMYRVIR